MFKFPCVLPKIMMKINGVSTIRDHWLHAGGTRRGLFFGVLSRCYFRVVLTVDNSLQDKYELTKWIIDNPLRFREFTWRNFSSEKHLTDVGVTSVMPNTANTALNCTADKSMFACSPLSK